MTTTRLDPAPPQTKSLAEIQSVLSGQLDRLVSGDTTPAVANATVNVTAAFLRIVKMQMDYHKLIGKTPNIPLLLTDEPGEKS